MVALMVTSDTDGECQTTSLRKKWKFCLPHLLCYAYSLLQCFCIFFRTHNHDGLMCLNFTWFNTLVPLFSPLINTHRLSLFSLFAIFILLFLLFSCLYGQLTPRLDVVTFCWYKYLMIPSFVCLLIPFFVYWCSIFL